MSIISARITCLLAWSLPAQNQTFIRCFGSQGPSQKIEFVFSASPETVRGEPQEVMISIAHSVSGRTWQCAC